MFAPGQKTAHYSEAKQSSHSGGVLLLACQISVKCMCAVVEVAIFRSLTTSDKRKQKVVQMIARIKPTHLPL